MEDGMTNLTKFGTYGFMSMLLAAQMATAPKLFADRLVEKSDKKRQDIKTKSIKETAKR